MARDRRSRNDDDDDDDRPRRARRPRDDDDDEPDDRPRSGRAKPDGGNTAVKVLLIVGGLLVVLTLICAGVGVYVYTSVARGVNDVQKQMQQDLQKNMTRMAEDQKQRQADEANSDKARATEAVTAFLQEVKAGRAAAAYRLTSAGFRQQTPEAEFAALLKKHAGDLTRSMPVSAGVFAPDTGTTFAFDIWAGFKSVKVTAVKENGKWAIDAFTVGDR